MSEALGELLRLAQRAAAETPADDLPALVGGLEAAKAAAWSRLMQATPEPGAGELLDPERAAQVAGVSKRWLLENTRGQAFRRDLGRKTVRFDRTGLLRWLRTVR